MDDKGMQDVPFLSREQIEGRARDVLRTHNLTSIPIDPVTLANRLGISVNNAKFSDKSLVGMIAKHGPAVQLLVNQSDSPGRKRFTIAHELGHHFLHLIKDGEFIDDDTNLFRGPADDEKAISPQRRREIQANMFAAALLMPAEDIRALWPTIKNVEEMARKFNVSKDAMGFRVVSLGLE